MEITIVELRNAKFSAENKGLDIRDVIGVSGGVAITGFSHINKAVQFAKEHRGQVCWFQTANKRANFVVSNGERNTPFVPADFLEANGGAAFGYELVNEAELVKICKGILKGMAENFDGNFIEMKNFYSKYKEIFEKIRGEYPSENNTVLLKDGELIERLSYNFMDFRTWDGVSHYVGVLLTPEEDKQII